MSKGKLLIAFLGIMSIATPVQSKSVDKKQVAQAKKNTVELKHKVTEKAEPTYKITEKDIPACTALIEKATQKADTSSIPEPAPIVGIYPTIPAKNQVFASNNHNVLNNKSMTGPEPILAPLPTPAPAIKPIPKAIQVIPAMPVITNSPKLAEKPFLAPAKAQVFASNEPKALNNLLGKDIKPVTPVLKVPESVINIPSPLINSPETYNDTLDKPTKSMHTPQPVKPTATKPNNKDKVAHSAPVTKHTIVKPVAKLHATTSIKPVVVKTIHTKPHIELLKPEIEVSAENRPARIPKLQNNTKLTHTSSHPRVPIKDRPRH